MDVEGELLNDRVVEAAGPGGHDAVVRAIDLAEDGCFVVSVEPDRVVERRRADLPVAAAALAVTIANEDLDPGYRAQFMFLPSESDIARVIGRDVDPLAVHQARKALRKAIGTALQRGLTELYERHEVKGPYSPAPEFASRRALRNAALGYLVSRGRREDIVRVTAHFTGARNATDELSALYRISALPE